MDPAFWNNLPAIIVAIGGFYAVMMQNRKIARDLAQNTAATVMGQRAVVDKVDSATREVTEQATVNTKVAANAAIQSALIAEKTAIMTVEQNREIVQSVGKIEERLNGGPGGLTQLTNRVMALEAMYSEVVKGQVDIVKSIEHIANVVDRKLGVKEV